jgi:hypothetical protein
MFLSAMKTLIPILVIAALAAPAARSADTFEGKVTMKMTSRGGAANEITYSMKGSRVLITMGNMGGMGSVVMDRDTNEITIMMPQQKMYMVQSIPQPPANPQTPNGPPQDTSLQETGVTETILGYTCTKYIVKSNKSTTEMWLTDQLGSFAGFSSAMGRGRPGAGRSSMPQAWEQALHGKNFFPMRIVESLNGGAESFRLEVTGIDKQPVDDSEFTPPADWKKFDMGGMMGGMGGFGPH